MGKFYYTILPMIMLVVGSFLRSKDADTKGADDVIGQILITAAPAVESLQNENESGVRKALTAVRDVIDGYLATSAPAS